MIEILALVSAGLCLLGIVIAVVTSEVLKKEKPSTERVVHRRTKRTAKKLEGDPAEAAAAAVRALSQGSS